MKIIALQAENIKKLTAVEIIPNGNLVQITGKNGQGKTSVLDSIWWALAGATHIQAEPIRKGATRARIRLDLGEIIVTRTFKPKSDGDYTSSINVENADGVKFPSPQTMLDNLLGQLTFDPLAFTRLDVKEQFKTLARFVPDIDFDAVQAEHQADYDLRTGISRKATEAKAAAAKIEVAPDCQTERVDTSVLTALLVKAGEANTARETKRSNREKFTKETAQAVTTATDNLAAADKRLTDDLNRRKAELKEATAKAEEELKGLQVTLQTARTAQAETLAKISNAGPLPDVADTKTLQEKIDNAAAINAKVEDWQRRQDWLKEMEQHANEAAVITERMDKRQADLKAKISASKFPVDGLTLEPNAVILNGIPFGQASDAEQLRASVAVAMALNPDLKVVRIRDGALLDGASMDLLAKMADERDFQIWIERVTNGDKVGFVLEDGHIVGQTLAETLGPVEATPPVTPAKPAPVAKPAATATPAPAKAAVAEDTTNNDLI